MVKLCLYDWMKEIIVKLIHIIKSQQVNALLKTWSYAQYFWIFFLLVATKERCECVGLLVYLSSSSQRTEFCALNCMANILWQMSERGAKLMPVAKHKPTWIWLQENQKKIIHNCIQKYLKNCSRNTEKIRKHLLPRPNLYIKLTYIDSERGTKLIPAEYGCKKTKKILYNCIQKYLKKQKCFDSLILWKLIYSESLTQIFWLSSFVK